VTGATPLPPSSANVAVRDRLESARRRSFVGRASELELFRAALDADELPFSVLYLHAPGGFGKTTLLRRFQQDAVEAGLRCARVDGRDVQSTPDGFLTALGAALSLKLGGVDAVAGLGRTVLLIDTYEALAGLDGWLRDELFPRLPGSVLVVAAGRPPLPTAWRADPGWRDLLRVVSLSSLTPDEATSYLTTARVPDDLHRQVVALTRGQPLALAVAVDVFCQAGGDALVERLHAPEVVEALLTGFVDDLPGVSHRHALQVLAEARTTTEAVLRVALDRDDVHDLFEWLRGLSFVESGPHGLFPHDLTRELLVADLKWRDSEVRDGLHRRIRAHAVSRLHTTQGRQQELAMLDFLFTEYSDPVFQSYWNDWATMGQALGEPAVPADRPGIVAMVARHEGDASATCAAHWFDRQPGSFVVYRRGVEVQGFLAFLSLHNAATTDIELDPATRAAWRYVQCVAPPAVDEDITMIRFLMDGDAYQGPSHLLNVGAVQHSLQVLNRPRLSWDFRIVADPEFWTPLWTHIGYERAADLDFDMGGRPFAMFKRDWRTAPLTGKWAELLEHRIPHPPADAAALPSSGWLLGRAEFAAAVKQALRDLRRPDLLAHNTLLTCRLVRDAAEARPATELLVDLVEQAADMLRQHPHDEKLYRVIDRTYLRPAPTQEIAAELLGLPSSTYRRHLTQGVSRIASWLWDRENARQP
jgi:hypothetical protein